MQDPERTKKADAATAEKRPYQPPVLTEYGSLDELVDAGVVGPMATSIVVQ